MPIITKNSHHRWTKIHKLKKEIEFIQSLTKKGQYYRDYVAQQLDLDHGFLEKKAEDFEVHLSLVEALYLGQKVSYSLNGVLVDIENTFMENDSCMSFLETIIVLMKYELLGDFEQEHNNFYFREDFSPDTK